MSRLLQIRHATRLLAAGAGPGACIGTAYMLRPAVIRLDAVSSPAIQQQRSIRTKVDPRVAREVASGSMTGFLTGVVVALFSRTLVILASICAVTVYVASRYGIDIPKILGVKKLLRETPVWTKFQGRPVYSASFLVTFALAAFARL